MRPDAELFPIFLKLAGRPVLVVGAGIVASAKVEALLPTGARLTVVAPEISASIRASGATLHERPFQPSDLEGQWLVISAAPPEINRAVADVAATHRIFVNAADDPSNASAYLGGVLRRGDLTLAISTSGRAPALAGLIREGLDALLPHDLDCWFARADELKQTWRSTGVPMTARRPQLMDALVKLRRSVSDDAGAAHVSAERRVRPTTGLVSLVGAGPGDPELLTYRAIQRLKNADLVLYDGLVPPQIVQLADRARHISVSKRVGAAAITQDEIEALMLAGARRGERVVRLKAGDPFVFGRGGEEAIVLARAGVPFEIVPGVSAAIAAPALAGIPVTHRGVASGFVVVSGHGAAAYGAVLGALPPASATVVVLMGLGERAGIQARLVGAGWDPATPAAIVFSASQPDQHVWTGTLGALGIADVGQREDPGVIVIGQVVSLATTPDLAHLFVREETSWQPTTIQRR